MYKRTIIVISGLSQRFGSDNILLKTTRLKKVMIRVKIDDKNTPKNKGPPGGAPPTYDTSDFSQFTSNQFNNPSCSYNQGFSNISELENLKKVLIKNKKNLRLFLNA